MFLPINNQINRVDTPNEIYGNINYYSSSIYSSLSNQKYNNFYYDEMNNNIPYRNRALTTSTANIMSLIHSNNKYIIDMDKSKIKPLYGYEEVYSYKNLKVYRSEDTLPLGYSTPNIMNIDEYNKLSSIYKEEALLNNVIVDSKSNNNFESNINKIDIDLDSILLSNGFKIDDGYYKIKVKKEKNFSIPLNEEYKDKIIFIKFDIVEDQSCSIGDMKIVINGVSNKLTCKEWRYYCCRVFLPTRGEFYSFPSSCRCRY